MLLLLFVYQTIVLDFVSFSYINVSQANLATQLRYVVIFNSHVIANFPQSVPVKEFCKSVNKIL